MKTLLIAALAAASFGISAQPASAAEYCYTQPVYCAPYKVSTCEVCRRSYCRTAYDACGRCYHYTVTVVTYADTYSNGSSITYTRSFRS